MDYEVKSIEGALEYLCSIEFPIKYTDPFGCWFRGQPDKKYELIPRIFRQGEKYGGVGYGEMSMVMEFMRIYPEMSVKYKNTFDLLTLMQHYRLPTRILDWTTSLLVGLYFTVREKNESDGVLFILNPRTVNIKARGGGGLFSASHEDVVFRSNLSKTRYLEYFIKMDEIKILFQNQNYKPLIKGDGLDNDEFDKALRVPIAVNPSYLSERMKLQHCTCTLHGGMIYGDRITIKPVQLEDMDGIQLLKMLIPARFKDKINKQLRVCGVHEAALFPEMENQMNYLKEKFQFKENYSD